MPIHIYNSLTRKKEEFAPLNPPQVNIYTCGVTVYDESHIGHARSLYVFDVIRRYLKYRGYRVRFVRNITDIDDKIINKAQALKASWKEVTDKYFSSYRQDLKRLGIEEADSEPKATENIPEMIAHIRGLIDKGYAYVSGGDVYFRVRKFPAYGRLSGQGIDQMEAGVRVEVAEGKEDHLDFALWKSSKPDEPSWESPWGPGRPGWHIECSVMSMKYLGVPTLDIHAGGRDLIFPHHENEIAQAEALTGKPFAKYWLHHGLLTINGQKMAKSLGNFVTIRDFASSFKNTDILKMFFLSAHYASPLDYTAEKVGEARQALERIIILREKIPCLPVVIKTAAPLEAEIGQARDRFIEAMDDDFNMPRGLACIFELVNTANKNIAEPGFAAAAGELLKELLDIFGISLSPYAETAGLTDAEVEAKIAERNLARRNKDYALSDKIRKELESSGVILEDSKGGATSWRRKV